MINYTTQPQPQPQPQPHPGYPLLDSLQPICRHLGPPPMYRSLRLPQGRQRIMFVGVHKLALFHGGPLPLSIPAWGEPPPLRSFLNPYLKNTTAFVGSSVGRFR